jgi:hypothetical protein
MIYGRRNPTPSTSQTLGGQISASEQNAVTIFAALLIADAIRESVGHLTRLIGERRE